VSADAAESTREALIAQVDACLPQTQCRRCGYPGCLPYARALVEQGVSIDGCPPGGERVRHALARTLGRPQPTTTVHAAEPPVVARIDEPDCIGCTKCIQACPVDAIVGAAGLLHGIVAAWCTGCALCLPVCPTDCIVLEPAGPGADDDGEQAEQARAAQARERHEALLARRARQVEVGDGPSYLDIAACSADELGETVLAAVRRRRARDGT